MLLTIFLTGCPREWHVSLIETADPLRPVFCVSDRSRCGGSGVLISEFIVAAVDDAGKYTGEDGITEPMWIIEPETNTPLNQFTYGILPSGWRELSSSKPLMLDTWYTVGHYYFRFKQVNNKVESETLDDEEFQEWLKLSHVQDR